MDGHTRSDWSAYERLVLAEIATLKTEVAAIDEKLVLLRIDVAQLKVKAGLWGAVAGMVPALVTGLAIFVSGAGGA